MKITNRDNRDIEINEFNVDNPKAIFIIVHGASEHSKRYDDFAKHLQANKILAASFDNLGHGVNKEDGTEGIFFSYRNGAHMLFYDLEDVVLHYYQKYNNVPIVVFGHSMGSMVVRMFAIHTKIQVDGIIICGSLQPDAKKIKAGYTFAKFITRLQGKRKISKMLNTSTFGTLETSISHNADNIDQYKKDIYCGEPFTNQAILDIVWLTGEVCNVNNIRKMQKTNYYIISGKDDPFSEKTKQLELFINILDINNFQYEYKFYDNAKHEILKESLKDEVYSDVLNFVDKAIKK